MFVTIMGMANEPAKPSVDKVEIRITNVGPKRASKLRNLARELIQISAGDTFSEAALSTSLDLLKKTGQFETIHVPDPDFNQPGIDLTFDLKARKLLKKITVNGNFPILKDSVIDRTDFDVGRVYTPAHLADGRKAIQSLFQEEGYVDTQVTITPNLTPQEHVILRIRIRKGYFYKLSGVRIRGNKHLSSAVIKMRMEIWPILPLPGEARRLIRKDIEKDVETIQDLYRRKGFPQCNIEAQIDKDETDKTARITIHIKEGPHYKLSFTGNESFSKRALKKQVHCLEEGDISTNTIQKDVERIKDKYVSAGYKDAAVSFQLPAPGATDNGTGVITFNIDEKQRYLVSNVTFTGNTHFDPPTLSQVVISGRSGLFSKPVFVNSTVTEDVAALETLYRSRGFTQIKVTPTVKHLPEIDDGTIPTTVSFEITEGNQFSIGELSINATPPTLASTLQETLSIETGMTYVPGNLKRAKRQLLSKLGQHGYLYATVTVDTVPSSDKSHTYDIRFDIDAGKQVYTGTFHLSGNFKTKAHVLTEDRLNKASTVVSLPSFGAYQRAVRNLECVRKASFHILGPQHMLDQVHFLTQIKERKPYFFDFAIGYDTRRDVYMSTGTGNRNLTGLNRELFVRTTLSGIGYSGKVGYVDHNLLDWDMDATATLYTNETEEKNHDFGTTETGIRLGLKKHLTERWSIGSDLSFELREQFATSDTVDESLPTYTQRGVFKAEPRITWDSVNMHIAPDNGTFAEFSIAYNRDILNDIDHFLTYRFQIRHYLRLHSRVVLALQSLLGTIHNLGDTSKLPEDQLFYLGGLSDVRGYDENQFLINNAGEPVGGLHMATGSTEFRIDLGNNLELPIFLDVGLLEDPGEPQQTGETLKWTIGSGLRYMTPLGPMGLLYAHPVNASERDDAGRIHFSIGYTF